MNIYQKKLKEGERLKGDMTPKVRERLESAVWEIRQIKSVTLDKLKRIKAILEEE